MELKECMV